jgi:L-fuconolactonase
MFDRRLILKGGLAAVAASALPSCATQSVTQSAKKVNAPFPLFDTHPHFYTNDLARYPVKSDITAAARTKVMENPMTPEFMLRFWDDIGVTAGTGVQYNTVYGTDNTYLLDVAKAHSNRIRAVVILNAIDPTTPGQLRKFTRENKIAGVRLFGSPVNGEFEFFMPAAIPAWDAINELGIACVLMLVGGDLNAAMGRVKEFATRYPNMRIVLDHLGYPNPANNPATFGLTANHDAVVGMKNLYWKFTSFHINGQIDRARVDLKAFLEHVEKKYGADHMVWGSDMGNVALTLEEHYAMTQRTIDATAGLPLAKRKAMFFDTANKVFVAGGTGRA